MADSPKEAEAAQALFCAIADHLGKDIYSAKVKEILKKPRADRTYDAFRTIVSFDDIEKSLQTQKLFKEDFLHCFFGPVGFFSYSSASAYALF